MSKLQPQDVLSPQAYLATQQRVVNLFQRLYLATTQGQLHWQPSGASRQQLILPSTKSSLYINSTAKVKTPHEVLTTQPRKSLGLQIDQAGQRFNLYLHYSSDQPPQPSLLNNPGVNQEGLIIPGNAPLWIDHRSDPAFYDEVISWETIIGELTGQRRINYSPTLIRHMVNANITLAAAANLLQPLGIDLKAT